MANIANRLRFTVDAFGHPLGDRPILSAIRHKLGPGNSLHTHVRAAERISNGMAQAPSIDNYIHAHKGDSEIELCGKLAIVREILLAESKSTLFVSRSDSCNRMNHEGLQEGWFNRFCRNYFIGCTKRERAGLADRLSSLKFIVFNYDRCVEHQLFNWIRDYFSLGDEETVDLLSHVEIYHPYGSIGRLDWQSGDRRRVHFGDEVAGDVLLELAGEIKTFTESSKTSPETAKIKQLVRSCQTVVFMGFGYDRLNLKLLASGGGGGFDKRRAVIGTAAGLSRHSRALVTQQLEQVVRVPQEQVILDELFCDQFVQDYSLSLSAMRAEPIW
ncbi:hypothetical protein [Agrilutibacter solisilvae]|uniref:SIR2-like domain-containing protein n=1 Tax=Agrilutibacter solisilvae TaxID=2763317 RepID=A0A974Y023_9GAMM|nr:hypothetical protein [Lysobacter solisilvae]QSX78110.1 hypothetical protein I8J32_015645 [Lysobacter solisilvae]